MPDGGAEKDARTLFVRNVAFSVDSAGLEQVFADIGPVRQCFLVTQKGAEGTKHRGIAFVQFAIPEDAQRAVEELNGTEVAGRRLKIELAHKRAPLQERKQRKRAAEGDAAAGDEAAHEDEAQQPAAAAKPVKPAPEPAAKRQKQQQQQQQQQQQPLEGAAAAAAAAAASAGQHAGKDKHKWVRSVALGGLSQQVKAHALQLAAAAGGLQEVIDPPPADVAGRAHLAQDGCSGEAVFLVYATVKEASHAVTQLHGKAISPADIAAAEAAAAVAAQAAAAAAAAGGKAGKKGKVKQAAQLSAKQLKQQQAAAAAAAAAAAGSDGGTVLWARHVSGEGALVKKWRLILRNLAFQATEAEVRKLLAPSGVFAWQVQLPTRPDGRSTGFAFASFLSYHEAEKALAAVNGQLLRKRPVAVDWALGKGQYQQLQQQQQQGAVGGQAAAAAAADAAEDSLQEDEDEEDEDSDGGLSSEVEEEGSEDFEQAGSSGDGEEGSEAEEGEEAEEDEEALSSDEEEASEDEGLEEGEEEEGSEDRGFDQDRAVMQSALDAVIAQEQPQQQQQAQQQQKQQQKQPPAGAPDAAAAAPFRGAAVASTVFVRGLPLDVTSPELQARFERFGPVTACRVVMDKATGKPKGTAFIEFKGAAGAAAAADACARARAGKGPDVTVKGVKLSVDLALTQDDARRLGQEQGGVPGAGKSAGQSNKGGKFDRRNLYLAKEGFIEEGSAQWEAMSENDRRKRKRAAEEKNQKLKSPNFAVSTTRLAVRNIPASWDEAKLKAAFIAGVKARATKERPVVKQAKILRDPERPDAAGHPGGKSRGFGFVEFADESHALAALRQLNNNPTAFGSRDRRPIVEFAVDNVKVLRARDDKLAKQKARQQQKKQEQQQPAAEAAGAAAAGDAVAEDDAAGAAEEAGAAAASAKFTAGKASSSSAGEQQQQQEQLSKRQLKRQKEKQRKLAKIQANGLHPAAADKPQQQQQQKQQQQGRPAGPGQQQQQQQNGKKASKRDIAAKVATAAAAAKSAQLAAKSARQQQQLQQEDAARGRKRAADAELDRLAAAGMDDGGAVAARGRGKGKQQQQQQDAGKKRHKPGRAAEERLEAMVQDYKSKLFGLGGAAGKGQQQQQQRDSLKRWFD
ncbi:hypothetical protein OEZ86_007402 [Tetradesmus obliquus]|nr:hypothetical protein OEZ86_007402 [Tetradesmus obliquus]